MKLKEYMELCEASATVTAFDSVMDSEFYFEKKEAGQKADPEFPYWEQFKEYLAEQLEINKIRENGIVVNLYEFLSQEAILSYVKERFYDEGQYGDEEDLKELLFDDAVDAFTHGYEDFCKDMMECFMEMEKGKEPEKLPYLLEQFEQAYGLKPYSQEEKEAFEFYMKEYPEKIPGEVVLVKAEWKKFQEYLKNEFPKERKPGVDSLIQQAASQRYEKGDTKEQEKTPDHGRE